MSSISKGIESDGSADQQRRPDAGRSRGPIVFLSVAWIVTVVVLLAGLWSAYDSYKRLESTIQKSYRIQELRGQIIYLDEVLTMSARMCAATGAPSWESRYREFESELEEVIGEALT